MSAEDILRQSQPPSDAHGADGVDSTIHAWTLARSGSSGARDLEMSWIMAGRMVRPERIELPTSWFVAKHSIQLSYGRIVAELRLRIITEPNRFRPTPIAGQAP